MDHALQTQDIAVHSDGVQNEKMTPNTPEGTPPALAKLLSLEAAAMVFAGAGLEDALPSAPANC
jgi:hypothetical protein